jgi:hypothetical protein
MSTTDPVAAFVAAYNTAESERLGYAYKSARIVASDESLVDAVDAVRRPLIAELGEANARLRAVSTVKCWTDEDGRRFVFASDLLAAVDPEAAALVAQARLAEATR